MSVSRNTQSQLMSRADRLVLRLALADSNMSEAAAGDRPENTDSNNQLY